VGFSPPLHPAARPREQFVWDQGYVDAPIARYRDADGSASTGTHAGMEEVVFALYDANHNVTALVDGSGFGHKLVERYAYTPYGQRVVLHGKDDRDGAVTEFAVDATGTDWGWWLGHQGLWLDAESGQYHNRRRQLAATLGAFASRDPLGYIDGLSLYEGKRGNPLSNTDPMGTNVCTCTAAVPGPPGAATNSIGLGFLQSCVVPGDAGNSVYTYNYGSCTQNPAIAGGNSLPWLTKCFCALIGIGCFKRQTYDCVTPAGGAGPVWVARPGSLSDSCPG